MNQNGRQQVKRPSSIVLALIHIIKPVTFVVWSMSWSTHVPCCHRYAHLAIQMEDECDLGIHSGRSCCCVDGDAECGKESNTVSLSSASNFALLAGVHDTALEIALCYMRTAGRQRSAAVKPGVHTRDCVCLRTD